MQPVHPIQYHVVKAEQAHRIAVIERRRLASGSPSHAPTEPTVVPVRVRRLGVAFASLVLALGLVAGAAAANQPSGGPAAGDDGCGGARPVIVPVAC